MNSAQFSELAIAQAPVLKDPRVVLWLANTLQIRTSAFLQPPVLGVARISPAEDGTYMPGEDGAVRAVILPAQVPTSFDDFDTYMAELMDLGGDLVAFDALAPARWWVRWGVAEALNAEAIAEAAATEQPLTLFPDPLAWMRAAGASGRLDCRAGAVVLDWRIAHRILAGLRTIQCATLDLAERVDRALAGMRRRPRILVLQRAA